MKLKSLALFFCVLFAFPVLAAEQTAYDRVMKSGTIRCGYGLWPSYLDRDPNTGKFSGIWYEYMNHVGQLLGLKIEWVEESGWGEINTALENNRYDVYCSGLWQDVRRAKGTDFANPISYQAIVAVTRHDDKRFDNNLKNINDPTIKVAAIDGEMAEVIQKADYPKAGLVTLPQLTEASQLFTNLVTKKADVTFTSPGTVKHFLETNPNTIRIVPADHPIRIFGEVLVLKLGEDKLRRILSHATVELLNNGTIEIILKKYEKYPGSFYRVAKPYEVEK